MEACLILATMAQTWQLTLTPGHPVEPLPPHQMLAMSIESRGVTQTEVSRATGIPVSTISELIAQKREFNRAHIEKLCAYFGLDPKAFIHVANRELVGR